MEFLKIKEMENMKEENNNSNYKEIYGDFTCPDCGRSTQNGDNIYDAGNGFCQVCAPDH